MFRFIRRHPGKFAALVTALAAAGLLLWRFRDRLDADRWIAYGDRLPLPVLLVAFLLLPLAGVPISIFLVLAGMRFGLGMGMAVSTLCIFFHNMVAYKITHGTFRRRLRNWLEHRGRSIPPIREERRALYTGIFAAVSGPPYALKLYLLALTDVPFRIYLWVGATTYSAFSLIPVAAGAVASEVKPVWILALVAGAALLSYGVHWIVGRLGARVSTDHKRSSSRS